MQHEDNLAVAVENQIEDDNCKAFMQRLGQLLQDKWAMDHDKQQLQAMAAAIKPINVHSIFAGGYLYMPLYVLALSNDRNLCPCPCPSLLACLL